MNLNTKLALVAKSLDTSAPDEHRVERQGDPGSPGEIGAANKRTKDFRNRKYFWVTDNQLCEAWNKNIKWLFLLKILLRKLKN